VLYVPTGDLPERDLFSPVQPPTAAPPPAPAARVAAVVVDAPVPLPPVPTPQLQFLGRMVTPTGMTMLLMSQQDKVLEIGVGMQLVDGFRVDGIMPDRLKLTYMPTGDQLEFAIPPPAER